MSKKVNVSLKEGSMEVIGKYNFDNLSKSDLIQCEERCISDRINEILNDYNNLLNVASKEIEGYLTEDEFNEIANVFNGNLFTSEASARDILYYSCLDAGVDKNILEKINKLNSVQAYALLQQIYKFWK